MAVINPIVALAINADDILYTDIAYPADDILYADIVYPVGGILLN